MNKFVNKLTERLDRIYTLYERYAWSHKNSEILVIIQDNSISFYLKDPNKLDDEFILTFDGEDKLLYPYISLEILTIVLGNVYVHQDENILFNNAHRPYVKMFINDPNILNLMMPIINNQDKEFIHKDMDYIHKAELQLSRYRNDDNNFINNLDSRINIMKKVLTR